MLRVYRIPHSTNVERVGLALAHKGLSVEPIDVPDHDRSLVRAASGQDLVPVLDHDGKIVIDSMEIVRYIESLHPNPPLYPEPGPRRAELLIFIDWFNRVWKRPPNLINDALASGNAEPAKLAAWQQELRESLRLFDELLHDRPYLFGSEFSAADLCAFPFLKYGQHLPADDPHQFHRVLNENLPVARYPRIGAWLARVETRPKAC